MFVFLCPLLCPHLALSLYVTCLSYSVSLPDILSVPSLPLPPLSWLLPKACAPTLNAWINLPISLNPWGEEQEEPAKGRQQPWFPEGSRFKPARPGRAEAKNFSLTLRALIFSLSWGGQVATSLELLLSLQESRSCPSSPSILQSLPRWTLFSPSWLGPNPFQHYREVAQLDTVLFPKGTGPGEGQQQYPPLRC